MYNQPTNQPSSQQPIHQAPIKEYQPINKTDKLKEYLLKRGIQPHLWGCISSYNVRFQPYNSPVPRNYQYLGIENFKGNGIVLTSYYEKMKSKSMGEKNPIIINYYSDRVYLFSSVWDFLSYLMMCGDSWRKVYTSFCFIIMNHTNITKKEVELLELTKFKEEKINICFRNNKLGDTSTNNVKKLFPKAIDNRDKWQQFNSLNDFITGKLKKDKKEKK